MLFIKKPYLELERKLLAAQQLFDVEGDVMFQRLGFISKHNLELFTHFEAIRKSQELIHQSLLPKAKDQLKLLKIYVDKRASSEFTSHYEPTKITVDLCTSSIKKYVEELKKIMQPEMAMKAKIAETKDHIRGLRVMYFKFAHQLVYLEAKFTFAFQQFDEKMLQIEGWLDTGNYDDIDLQLTKIRKICLKLMDVMESLPPLCSYMATVIPEKAAALKKAAEDMQKQGYPIHHLLVYDTLQKVEFEKENLDRKLQQFEILGLEPAFKNIMERLDAFYPLFEKEKAAKQMVEADYETTYQRGNDLEKRLAKLNADLPRIKKHYVLEDSRLASIEVIQRDISELNRIKRGLDTLVLSGTKQPYTLQLAKIRTLNTLADDVDEKIEAFSQYMLSLKKQAMEAFQKAQALFQRYKALEQQWQAFYLPKWYGPFETTFTLLYERLHTITEALQQLPINMNIVDENLRYLNEEGEPFIQQLEKDYRDALQAEQALLKANQDRHRTSDHQRFMSLAEAKFFEGRFQEVFQDIQQLLKKMPDDPSQQKHKKTRG